MTPLTPDEVSELQASPLAVAAARSILANPGSFYSLCSESGFELHDEECEAKEQAQEAFNHACDSEYAEQIASVEWGLLIRLGGAFEVSRDWKDHEGRPVEFVHFEFGRDSGGKSA